MAVGFDAATEFPTTQSAGASNTLTLSWNHIPVTSTPRGVGLFVSYAPSSLTAVTTVKYGGVSLSRKAYAVDTATEPGVMEFWYLGAGIPTGTQAFNVVTSLTGAGMWGVGFTVSASFSTTVAQTITVQEDTSLNEKTLSTIQVGVRFAGAYYGGATPPATGTNSTVLFDIDYGAYGARVVRETTAGSGKRVVGFSAGTSDDVAAIYVAIDEELQPQNLSGTGLASSFATGLAVLSQPSTATYTLSATVPTGWKYTTIGTPNTLSQYSVAYSSSPVLATGDLVLFQKWARSGGVTLSSSVTISTNGIVAFSPRSASASLSFQYFFWDESVSVYASTVTWTSAPIKSLVPTGLSSSFSTGLANLTSFRYISATGIPSSAAFGASSVYSRKYVSATGLATTQAFGTHTVLAGIRYISASGVPSSFSAGAHTVSTTATTGTYSLSVTVPSGWKYTVLSSPDISSTANIAYGQSATVVTGDIVLFQEYARKNGATTSYSITISTDGSIVVFAQSDSASLSFQYFFWDDSTSDYGTTGTFSILEWTTLVPTGLSSNAAYGTHTILGKSTTLSASGLSSFAAFGAATVRAGQRFLSASGVPTANAFGTHTVLAGKVTIYSSGLSSSGSVGLHNIASQFAYLSASGLSSYAAYGQHVVQGGRVFLSASGVPSTSSLGSHTVLAGQVFLSASGLATFASIGPSSVVNKFAYIVPTGISSSFSTGLADIYAAGATIRTTGLGSSEAFGTHTLVPGDVILVPSGYFSPEAFGTHLLTAAGVVILPSGLSSSLSFGTAVLTSFAGIQTTGLDTSQAFGQHVLVFTQYISPSGKSYFAIGVARINEAGVIVPLPVQDIFEWLYESGATGGVMKRTKEYLKLQGFTGTTNTALFKWLRSLGYTKSLTSMLDKFERDNTNQHGPE